MRGCIFFLSKRKKKTLSGFMVLEADSDGSEAYSICLHSPAHGGISGQGRGSRSPTLLLRLASPALECLRGFVSPNNWDWRNQAFKGDTQCHPFHLASEAGREEMLLSDPRYWWGRKLQGSDSVCIQKKQKETITHDKCFLLFPATSPIPLQTPMGKHSCSQSSSDVLMGHKLDRKNLQLKVYLKEK